MVSFTVVGVGLVSVFVAFVVGYVVAWYVTTRDVERRVERRKDEALERSRSVIGGQVAEQLAPFLPGFPGRVSEAKFLGAPIDYVVFDGMDEKDISRVTFVEVKTGSASLSAQERRLRDTIRDGEVRWVEHRVDGDG